MNAYFDPQIPHDLKDKLTNLLGLLNFSAQSSNNLSMVSAYDDVHSTLVKLIEAHQSEVADLEESESDLESQVSDLESTVSDLEDELKKAKPAIEHYKNLTLTKSLNESLHL